MLCTHQVAGSSPVVSTAQRGLLAAKWESTGVTGASGSIPQR